MPRARRIWRLLLRVRLLRPVKKADRAVARDDPHWRGKATPLGTGQASQNLHAAGALARLPRLARASTAESAVVSTQRSAATVDRCAAMNARQRRQASAAASACSL